MIVTNSVNIEKNKFFKILLVRYLKTRWPLYGSVLLIAIYISQKDISGDIDSFFLTICLLYPLIIVFQFWRWVNTKENQIFFKERTYEIDQDKITGKTDEKNFSTIEKQHFIKADTILNTYLLYISKSQFFYFPFDSFQSEEDRKWFQDNYIDWITK